MSRAPGIVLSRPNGREWRRAARSRFEANNPRGYKLGREKKSHRMRPGGSLRVFRPYSGWGTRGAIAGVRGRGLQAQQNQPRARTPACVPPPSRQGRQATPGGLGPPTKARALRGWCQGRPIWAARHVGSTFRARAKIVPRWYRHGPYKSCSETATGRPLLAARRPYGLPPLNRKLSHL